MQTCEVCFVEVDFVGDVQDASNVEDGAIWATPSLEDPLEITETSKKSDKDLLSLLATNNERAKDLGLTTSDSEFMPLDRLDDRNKNALVNHVDNQKM